MVPEVKFGESAAQFFSNVKEQIVKHAHHTWHYIKHRDLLNGLPFAMAAGAGCAYLFSCCHPAIGAAYGALSYTLITLFWETLKDHPDPYHAGKVIGIVISYAIPTAFMFTVLKNPIPFHKAGILAVAALIGQLPILRRPVEHHYGECGEDGLGSCPMDRSILSRIFDGSSDF